LEIHSLRAANICLHREKSEITAMYRAFLAVFFPNRTADNWKALKIASGYQLVENHLYNFERKMPLVA
jgi:hypothetical protein